MTAALVFPAMAGAVELTEQQIEVLTKNLNDPDSARFRNLRKSPIADFVVCGEINWVTPQGGLGGYKKFWIDDEGKGGIDPEPGYAWARMVGCE